MHIKVYPQRSWVPSPKEKNTQVRQEYSDLFEILQKHWILSARLCYDNASVYTLEFYYISFDGFVVTINCDTFMLSTDIVSSCTLTVIDISVWYAMSQVFNFATCV